MKLDTLHRLIQAVPDVGGQELHQWQLDQLQSLGLDPNAFYQELEMSFRFAQTHWDTSYAGTPMQLHSHDFYELLFCTECDGVEYLVGPERYRLQEGDLIFVPPGISHRPVLPEHMERPYSRYVLWLSKEFMEHYAALYSLPITQQQARPNLLRTAGTRWEQLGDIFRRGVLEAEQRLDGWEAAVVGNTMMLLTTIKRATNDRTARSLHAEQPELLDRITAYVENNFHRPITLGSLAATFYISESSVSHLFQQKLGVSFYRYVTQRRLIGAKGLIGEGLPMEEVARRVGFQDYSGFYRAFRKEYGISPRQYRSLQASQKTGS